MRSETKSYALRWTAASGFGFPVLELNRSHDWTQFREVLRRFWGPPQNVTFADRAGNIGFQTAGAIPIRRGFYGNVPVHGASGTNEWSGYIPFDDLPSVFNPASGIVATANQNPFPPSFAGDIEGNFADSYRVTQIRELLKTKGKLRAQDMLDIQRDVYSGYHLFLAKRVIAACQHLNCQQPLNNAIPLLASWNGQMDRNEAAPLITELLNQEISHWLVARIAPDANVTLTVKPRRIETLIEQEPPGWVDNDNWAKWLLQRLSQALESGRRRYGEPTGNWRYGWSLAWEFKHPIGSHLPMVNRFFDIGPIPMSGAETTVKQTTSRLGPSMRMVVDWGDIDRSVQNIAVGESGQVGSKHYKDQWPAYYCGESYLMQFRRVNAQEVLRIVPR